MASFQILSLRLALPFFRLTVSFNRYPLSSKIFYPSVGSRTYGKLPSESVFCKQPGGGAFGFVRECSGFFGSRVLPRKI
jgi:hypothetical protein